MNNLQVIRPNRLKLIGKSDQKTNDGHIKGVFLCECGIKKVLAISYVRRNLVKSCGCLTKDTKPNLIHGMKFTKEYRAWNSLKNRCRNKSNKDYHRYGGAGIDIYNKWADDFIKFFNHIGKAPSPKHQVDRINNTKGYFPGNVRWATAKEQATNRKNSSWWHIKGKTFESANDAAKCFSVSVPTIHRWVKNKIKKNCFSEKKYA